MDWQQLEEAVRKIAENHWSCTARPETLAGVKCDIVLRPSPEEWVVIEVTKEKSLGKLRDDLAKLNTVRLSLVPDGIVCRAFFVSAHEVSSLRESGRAQRVEVLSLNDFRERFIGKGAYDHERRKVEFGSALDPETNSPDNSDFIEISYIEDSTGSQYTVKDISKLVLGGRKVVLLGEFGTGKSRCSQEVFDAVSKEEFLFPTFAINLREHWGHKTFDILIRSHLSSLGLSGLEDNAVKLCRSGLTALILDGFDEIGSQSWSGEPNKLRAIRQSSLQGVRDLVAKSENRGVLLCGRDHYFSNNEEMLTCLGLDNTAIILRCPDEFSDEQARLYISKNSELEEFPEWGPRKPLICQLFSKLEPSTMEGLLSESAGEVDFFEKTLAAICERETRIHPSIDSNILSDILLELSKICRRGSDVNQELTPAEINDTFYSVSGFSPMDEASSILQRLPYLGRVSSGSGNRRFVDDYAQSGLEGYSLTRAFTTFNKDVSHDVYKKPLGQFGIKFLGAHGLIGEDAEKYVRFCNSKGNTQIAADYLCSKVDASEEEINCKGFDVFRANILELDLSERHIKGLSLSDVHLHKVILNETQFEQCAIQDCILETVVGASDADHLPECFDDSCLFENFSSVDNVSRISELALTDSQKTLIAIIRKLFFQPGRGRKEEALLRGTSKYWDAKTAQEIVRYMQSNGIIFEAPGDRGKLFIPNRKHMRRMGNIISMLGSCDDVLWDLAS
ncbi:hypothetical protein [Thalassorhabdomicrobium marinisediminis]|uniref:hypothetical protein n=1 Tax=Thalassorhabdomicrobium marinisediminis TaxID=2170577 RepID=UPI0024919D60|nr:hypothetical protein [Thalassorhabdomicrobium marinisediminis]